MEYERIGMQLLDNICDRNVEDTSIQSWDLYHTAKECLTYVNFLRMVKVNSVSSEKWMLQCGYDKNHVTLINGKQITALPLSRKRFKQAPVALYDCTRNDIGTLVAFFLKYEGGTFTKSGANNHG